MAARRLARWARRRPVLAAAVAYAVLAVAFLAPGLLPGHTISGGDLLWSSAPWDTARPSGLRQFGANGDLTDAVTVFQPLQQEARHRLPSMPLWDPNIGGGRPLLADQQSAVFSPFSLPTYVLPYLWSLALVAALKILVACLGTFLLARALGIRDGPAFVAGLAYGFSLFFVVWLPWPVTSVWALLPWLLWATDRVVREPGPGPAALLAALVGLQFLGGHPESSFHVLFATAAFFVLRAAVLRRWRAPLVAFGGALIVGAGLAALTLIPLLELVSHSRDVAHRREMGHLRLDRRLVAGVLLPDYWGRPTQVSRIAFEVQRALYLGALPALLSGVAVALRPTRQRVAIALFGALMLAVTFGVQPFFAVFNHLPVFATAYNTRLPIVALMCVALLAGWGLDDLLGRWPGGWRARGILLAAPLAVLLPAVVVVVVLRPTGQELLDGLKVAWAFVEPRSDQQTAIHLGALYLWLTFAGLTALLLLARARGRVGGAPLVALAAAIVVGDLFRAGVGQNPASTTARARQPTSPAIRHLQSQGTARFAGLTPGGGRHGLPLPPDVGVRYGLYDARSYDYPVVERYDRLWREEVTPPGEMRPQTTTIDPRPGALHVLSAFGVRSLLQDRFDAPLRLPGVRLAYDGPDARVYENRAALPRAWVVGAQWAVGAPGIARRALADRRVDLRRVLVVERAVPGLALSARAGAPPAGSAVIVHYGSQRVTIDVQAQRAGELVLSDVAYPGWKATIDGRPVRLDRVDYLFRGVPVPFGPHRVEMRYQPKSWRAGWIVSLVALIAVSGAAGIAGWRRRRR
jgi:hypothetical protein